MWTRDSRSLVRETLGLRSKILIVDDHEIVRQGIRTILATTRPEWEICREAQNGQEAIEAVKQLNPDVVILDISMPMMSGIEAAKQIAKMGGHSRILIFTMHDAPALAAEIEAAGAHGYVVKSQAVRDLIFAIDTLLAGGKFFSPLTQSEIAKRTAPDTNTAV